MLFSDHLSHYHFIRNLLDLQLLLQQLHIYIEVLILEYVTFLVPDGHCAFRHALILIIIEEFASIEKSDLIQFITSW